MCVCVRERERVRERESLGFDGFGKEERVKLIVCERDWFFFFLNKKLGGERYYMGELIKKKTLKK